MKKIYNESLIRITNNIDGINELRLGKLSNFEIIQVEATQDGEYILEVIDKDKINSKTKIEDKVNKSENTIGRMDYVYIIGKLIDDKLEKIYAVRTSMESAKEYIRNSELRYSSTVRILKERLEY